MPKHASFESVEQMRQELGREARVELDGFSAQLAQNVNKLVSYVAATQFGDIDKTGINDSTKAIQDAIDYLSSNGGGVVLLQDGTYLANIIIKSGVVLRGVSTANIYSTDIAGTILKPYDKTRPCIRFGDGVVYTNGGILENVKVLGDSSSEYGLYIGGCTHINLRNVTVKDFKINIMIENLQSLNTYYIIMENVKTFSAYEHCLKILWRDGLSSFTTSVFATNLLISKRTSPTPNIVGTALYIDGVNASLGGRCDCGTWADSSYDNPVYIKRSNVHGSGLIGKLATNGDFFVDSDERLPTVKLDGLTNDNLNDYFSGNVRIDGGVVLPNGNILPSPNFNLVNVLDVNYPIGRNSFGKRGEMAISDGYLYVCYKDNYWMRVKPDELFKNESSSVISYAPSTWDEWTKVTGVTGDNTGLTFTANGTSALSAKINGINGAFQTNKKYGVLFEVVSNTLVYPFRQSEDLTGVTTNIINGGVTGKIKHTFTTQANITTNLFTFTTNSVESSGNLVKIKNVRIFELKPNSVIEYDFNSLPIDELFTRYPFE